MNREQVMKLNDQELNEESAFRVMGWKRNDEEYPESFDTYLDADGNKVKSYFRWNPATDHNDVMELQSKLNDLELIEYTVNLVEMIGHTEDIDFGCLSRVLNLPSRQRTIAALLARVDGFKDIGTNEYA